MVFIGLNQNVHSSTAQAYGPWVPSNDHQRTQPDHPEQPAASALLVLLSDRGCQKAKRVSSNGSPKADIERIQRHCGRRLGQSLSLPSCLFCNMRIVCLLASRLCCMNIPFRNLPYCCYSSKQTSSPVMLGQYSRGGSAGRWAMPPWVEWSRLRSGPRPRYSLLQCTMGLVYILMSLSR